MGCGDSQLAEQGIPADVFLEEGCPRRRLGRKELAKGQRPHGLALGSVRLHGRDDDTEIPGGLFGRLLAAAADARTASGQHVEVVAADGSMRLRRARGRGPLLCAGCLVRVAALRPEAWSLQEFARHALDQQGVVACQKDGELFRIVGLGLHWFHAAELELLRAAPPRRFEDAAALRAAPLQEHTGRSAWRAAPLQETCSIAAPLQEHTGLSTEVASRDSSRATSASSVRLETICSI